MYVQAKKLTSLWLWEHIEDNALLKSDSSASEKKEEKDVVVVVNEEYNRRSNLSVYIHIMPVVVFVIYEQSDTHIC